MKKSARVLIIFLFLTSFSVVFAFWSKAFSDSIAVSVSAVKVGGFSYLDCYENIFVVDDDFYQKYFHTINGKKVWRNNLSNQEVFEIGQITKNYDFIKTDVIYKVRQNHYHLYHNSLPFLTEYYLGWAVEPVQLEAVDGWSYFEGRVVVFEGVFYMAKFYASNTPDKNPSAWQRLNEIEDNEFEKYENTCIVNYSQLKSSQSVRPYIWVNTATYKKNDIVKFNNDEYRSIIELNQALPTESDFWEVI